MVYILGGARTPNGSFLGEMSQIPAPKLGAHAIAGALERSGVSKDAVDEVFMGQVVSAGSGQAPARQAALGAGLCESVPCTTINKVCGSGMKTIIVGAQSIACEDNQVVVAGGMESMSMAPHLLPHSRRGIKFGESSFRDSVQWDGLWDVYSDRPMGACAEECASKYAITREEQDEFAIESFKRAQKALNEGVFDDEIVPVPLKTRKGETRLCEKDEGPFKAKFDKIPLLPPVFGKDGTITAANASTLNDGACALVVAGESHKGLAKFKILAHAGHAQNPTWFTTAPIECLKKLFAKTSLKPSDVDLFEINEAFSCVVLAAMKEFELNPSKVNIYGGGVSLGHPIGQSGTRIVLTLMNALTRTKGRLGVATLCIGGGEALALLIERV
ncbi:MAG: thiolase family protein [Bacteriovoracales bacterium]|nr:thiolase family protein [Bacteriovoracales bacterium]